MTEKKRIETNATAFIDRVSASLSDPLHLSHCCTFYNGFLLAILDPSKICDVGPNGPLKVLSGKQETSLATLEKKHHALYDHCIAFLTVIRSREDMGVLKETIKQCSCDLSDPVVSRLHAWKFAEHVQYTLDPIDRSLDDNSLGSMVLGMAILLQKAIGENRTDFKDVRKAKRATERGESRSWPNNPLIILGDGLDTPTIEKKVTMLCRWHNEYLALCLTRLLQSVCATGGRRVVLAFLASAYLPGDVLTLLRTAIAKNTPFRGDLLTAEIQKPARPLTYIFRFIGTYQSEPDGVSVAYFYGKHCDELLELLTKAGELWENIQRVYGLQVLDDPQFKWIHIIGGTGGSVHSKLNKPNDPSKYHQMIISAGAEVQAAREKDITMENPWDVAEYLPQLLAREKCTSPTCPETFAGSGKKFMYCSGCKRAPYCSAECQRSDWKNPQRPHKSICKDLALLAGKLQYPSTVSRDPLHRRGPVSQDKLRGICQKEGISVEIIKRLHRSSVKEQEMMKIHYAGSVEGIEYTRRLY